MLDTVGHYYLRKTPPENNPIGLLRFKARKTQKECAVAIGLGENSYGSYERTGKGLDPSRKSLLAAFFGCALEELLDAENEFLEIKGGFQSPRAFARQHIQNLVTSVTGDCKTARDRALRENVEITRTIEELTRLNKELWEQAENLRTENAMLTHNIELDKRCRDIEQKTAKIHAASASLVFKFQALHDQADQLREWSKGLLDYVLEVSS